MATQRCVTARRVLREGGGEPLPGLVERLHHHARVGQHRHEVVVAGPARDDVPVQVVDDAGAGDLPRFIPTLSPSGR